MESGVDPRAVDTMSLYELASMNAELAKRSGKGSAMADDDYERLSEYGRSMGWME